MKRFVFAFVIVLLLSPCVSAQQTHRTVPSSSASFMTDLQTFLKNEEADRFADQFIPFVVSGGTHSTVAGLTATPTALVAYPSGYYATESGAITYPNNATCWVVATYTTTSALTGSFSRVAGTKYATDCVSATQPTAPSYSVYLMKVVTSGGAITAVTDLRTRSPIAAGIYTSAGLPPASTVRRFGFLSDGKKCLVIDNGVAWRCVGYIDVQDFGALRDDPGDGTDTGTDNATAFTNAVAAAEGGVLFVPASGTNSCYLLKSAILVNVSLTILGEGSGSCIKFPEIGFVEVVPKIGLLSITGNKVRVTGIKIIGSADTVTFNHDRGKLIWIQPPSTYVAVNTEVTVDHNIFTRHGCEGIQTGGQASPEVLSDRLIFTDNYFYDVGWTCPIAGGGTWTGLPALQPQGDNIVVANNIFVHTGGGIGAGGRNVVVTGNILDDCEAGCIGTADTSAGIADGNYIISNNTLDFNGRDAAQVYGINTVASTGGADYSVLVSSNVCTGRGSTSYTYNPVCYYAGSATKSKFSDNIAIIDGKGIGFQNEGTAAGTSVTDWVNNTCRIENVTGASICYSSTPATGNTATTHLRGNKSYGATLASSSFSYKFNTASGGTIVADFKDDWADQGNWNLGATSYGAGQLDSLYFTINSAGTANTYNAYGLFDKIQIGSKGSYTGTVTQALTWNATATVADGGTITHGVGTTPTACIASPVTAGEMASVTALGATTFTVALKKHDGSAGTTQTIYWACFK